MRSSEIHITRPSEEVQDVTMSRRMLNLVIGLQLLVLGAVIVVGFQTYSRATMSAKERVIIRKNLEQRNKVYDAMYNGLCEARTKLGLTCFPKVPLDWPEPYWSVDEQGRPILISPSPHSEDGAANKEE